MISPVNALRAEYRACIKVAEETDSKSEERTLLEDAKALLKKLRAACPHEHTVILHSQYGGSYLRDYDDSGPEGRICLCCGISEYKYDNAFEILKVRPISRFESSRPKEIEEPLKHFLTELVELAKSKGYP